MKKGASEIVIVLDRSGSMTSTKADAEGGLREFIAKQRLIPGDCRVTFYRFDDRIDRVFEDKPIERVQSEELRLEPRGSTALLDAMAKAIDEVGARLAQRADYDRPEFVYVVVVTDGYENSSVHTTKDVFEKVSHQRDKYDWQFIFIGADQDAIASAAKLGIKADQTLNYKGSHIGTTNAYRALTESMSDARLTGQTLCFNDSQRSSAVAKDPLVSTTGK
jgi:uncharacterized protein YegL